MKILFITNSIGIGGAERVLLSLANYFAKNGHSVSIFSRLSANKPVDTLSCKIEIYDGSRSHLCYINSIRRKILRDNPDVIIAFQYYNSMCAVVANLLSLRCRIIVSERTDPSYIKPNTLKSALRNLLYSKSDMLVCQTDDAKEYFPTYVKKKAIVILNPLKENLPIRQDINAREKTIVTFGRLVREKNFSLLINSFELFSATHPDFKLIIYGDGYEKQYIENIVSSKCLNNKVWIYPASEDVHKSILNASMYISSSDFEGLSNSMIEAMAIGLPVVCTDCPCGGAKMLIRDGINGILVPVRDSKAMCKAMCKIVEDRILAERLSIEAQKIREELALPVIASQWERLFY